MLRFKPGIAVIVQHPSLYGHRGTVQRWDQGRVLVVLEKPVRRSIERERNLGWFLITEVEIEPRFLEVA